MKYLQAAYLLVYNSDSNSVYQYIAYITFPRATCLLHASLGKLSSTSTLHIPNTRLLRASLVLPQHIYSNIPAVKRGVHVKGDNTLTIACNCHAWWWWQWWWQWWRRGCDEWGVEDDVDDRAQS
jgi:hypothetical protein